MTTTTTRRTSTTPPTTIVARFRSACRACPDPVLVGQRVHWVRGERGVTHLDCWEIELFDQYQEQLDQDDRDADREVERQIEAQEPPAPEPRFSLVDLARMIEAQQS